jgi:hypothetical protein
MSLRFVYRFASLISILALGQSLMAMTQSGCKSGPPTARSYTWNFPKETSNLLQQVQQDAMQVRSDASNLQELDLNAFNGSWRGEADYLNQARTHINDLDAKLCRLHTIERLALPWQRRAIHRITPAAIELTDYTRNAIKYLDHHQDDLADTRYWEDADLMYHCADRVVNSVNTFEEYATDLRNVKELGRQLNLKASS